MQDDADRQITATEITERWNENTDLENECAKPMIDRTIEILKKYNLINDHGAVKGDAR
jgi:hypothetical protein